MKVVTVGEIMLRLAPLGYYRFVQADQFGVEYGGGEANVAVSLANFGANSVYVTKLPDHEIGQSAVNSLRRYGVNTDYIVRGGDRIGIYFLEKGASQRASKVIYDRKGSAFAESSFEEYQWDEILKDADWLHLTGITPALGGKTADLSLRLCEEAKRRNIVVSCDLNYRKKLWTKEEARNVMLKLMNFVDVCIANEEDANNIFGICAENTDVISGDLDKNGYVSVARQLREKFGFKKVAITLRSSISASDNVWGALLYDGDPHFSTEYKVHIVDRVGGGDSFAAALIYSLLRGDTSQEAVEYAAAPSCLKHSIEGDCNLVSDSEVRTLAKGDASGRVSR